MMKQFKQVLACLNATCQYTISITLTSVVLHVVRLVVMNRTS